MNDMLRKGATGLWSVPTDFCPVQKFDLYRICYMSPWLGKNDCCIFPILKCSHRHPHLHVSPRSGGFFFVTMLLQWLTTAFSKVTTTSYNTQWWKTNGRLLHESLTDAFMNWYMHSLSNSPSNSLSNHWTNYFIKSINYFSISWLITEFA